MNRLLKIFSIGMVSLIVSSAMASVKNKDLCDTITGKWQGSWIEENAKYPAGFCGWGAEGKMFYGEGVISASFSLFDDPGPISCGKDFLTLSGPCSHGELDLVTGNGIPVKGIIINEDEIQISGNGFKGNFLRDKW